MFEYFTAIIYWLITLLWIVILALYLLKFRSAKIAGGAVAVLLTVLAIDAFRTVFENLYFGLLWNSHYGFLPRVFEEVLSRPELLVIPKAVNIIGGILVLFLLIRRWIPDEVGDRVKRIEALQQSEQRFQDIASNVPGIVFQYLITTDETYKFHYVSDKIRDLLGIPASEVIRDQGLFMAAIEPDDRELWYRTISESIRQMQEWEWEGRLIGRDNRQTRWFRGTAQPRKLKNGDTQLNGMLLDVTEKLQAERHLRESERKFRGLFDQAQELIHLVNRDGMLLDANPMELSTLQYSRDQLIGTPLESIVQTGFRAAVTDAIQQAFRGIVVSGLEFALVTRGGNPIHVDANVVPNRTAGRVDYVRMMMRDITERKAAEHELKIYRDQLEELVRIRTSQIEEKAQMIEQVSNAVIATDMEFRITSWNRGAEQMFGYLAADVIGKPIDFIHQDTFRNFLPIRIFNPLKDKGRIEIDVPFRKQDGNEFFGHLSGSTVKNRDGVPVGTVGYIVDVSEAKLVEAELRTAKEQAEQASKAKSEFLSRMSHELRTPMNAILGFAQLLELEIREKEHKKNAHEIVHAGRHLLALINEILDLSHVESGKIKLSIEPVNLVDIVRECLAIIKPMAVKREIRITEAITQQQQISIYADATRLRQVILNLLSNSIKYNRDGGSVILDWDATDTTYGRLSFRDSGLGLTDEQQKHLFFPFERLGAQHSEVEGTGIGLVISRHLMEMMGGNIFVESEPGKGSVFSITLPKAADLALSDFSAAPEAGRSTSHLTLASPDRNVLYIEDNPANLRLMEQIFKHHTSIHLLSAPRPELGLELAIAHKPQLILLDINLPGMNGYEVNNRLRLHPETQDIPVIAVSANALPKDIKEALAAGFVAYLAKPIRVDELLGVLGQFLGEQKTRRIN